MSVKQFSPEEFSPKQTTTMDIPVKVLKDQVDHSAATYASARIGFVSLGCLR